MAIKRAGTANPFALVIWGSALAVPPLLGASLALEGPAALADALRGLTAGTLGALAYIVYFSTLIAFSLWADLLRKNPPSTVAPFTLAVPVTGFLGAAAILGEPLLAWKLGAAALVLAGLGLHLFGGRLVGVMVRVALARQP